jgi:hypothetical protein
VPNPSVKEGCSLWVRIPPWQLKLYIMKDALLTVLATVLSVVVVGFGSILFVNFLEGEFTIIPFLIGLVGYFIALRPAINEWEATFKKLFKIKDEE